MNVKKYGVAMWAGFTWLSRDQRTAPLNMTMNDYSLHKDSTPQSSLTRKTRTELQYK